MVSTIDSATPRMMPAIERPAHAAEPGHDDDAERAADIGAVERRLDRRDDDQQRAGDAEHGGGDAERPLLDPDRVRAHQPQRLLVLRDRADGASHEGSRQIERQQDRQADRHRERDELPDRNAQVAEPPGAADIGRGDRTLVDAELQDDQHFDDEGDAEEEGDAAHAGVAAALLERLVVEAVGDEPEQEEQRRDQEPGQQRVDLIAIVEQEHTVGRQHQEGRMRDVGNVEQAERHRQADADGRIEAAEQHAEHDRTEQQVKRKHVNAPFFRRTRRLLRLRDTVAMRVCLRQARAARPTSARPRRA